MLGNTVAKRKRSEHYVNNKEFLAALSEYREEVENFYSESMEENQQRKIEQLRDGIQSQGYPGILGSVF